jgi:hypothetical protein
MATVSTTVTTAETTHKLGVHLDAHNLHPLEAAALHALQHGIVNYNITHVTAEPAAGGAAIKYTITYTEKPLNADVVKPFLK